MLTANDILSSDADWDKFKISNQGYEEQCNELIADLLKKMLPKKGRYCQ